MLLPLQLNNLLQPAVVEEAAQVGHWPRPPYVIPRAGSASEHIRARGSARARIHAKILIKDLLANDTASSGDRVTGWLIRTASASGEAAYSDSAAGTAVESVSTLPGGATDRAGAASAAHGKLVRVPEEQAQAAPPDARPSRVRMVTWERATNGWRKTKPATRDGVASARVFHWPRSNMLPWRGQ